MRRSVVVLLLSLSTSPLLAGSLDGRVVTPDGRPLPQVLVSVRGSDSTHTLVTGPEGRFRLEDVAAGHYDVTLQAPGFTGTTAAEVGAGASTVDLTAALAPVREHVVVTAARTETPRSSIGVSTDSLDADAIEDAQSSDLVHLLPRLPGVSVARTGTIGLQASAFVRGGNSNAARVLIDGVPVNEPGGFYDFGALLPLELEQVEVVRGAASSLYGTDALAGVISLTTRRAAPQQRPGARLEAEGGDDAWQRGLLGTTGRAGQLDWSAGLERLTTDSDQPNSRFESNAFAGSVGFAVDPATDLRAVVRASSSTVGTPGQLAFGRPDLDATIDRDLFVGSLQVRHVHGGGVHALTAGLSRNHQLSLDPEDSGSFTPSYNGVSGAFPLSDFPDALGLQNDTERATLGYQLEQKLGRGHLLATGLDLEHETGELGALSDPANLLSPHRTNVGVYVQDQAALGSRVFATFGARVEHNASFGTRVVPRAALAVRVAGGVDSTMLRASGGLGIKEPSFFESFGVSFYAQGNPDLKPERSQTFDVGLEQRLISGRLRLQATAFHHDYRDQVAYHIVDFDTFQGSYVNLGHTRAKGYELMVQAAAGSHVDVTASYTKLNGEVLVSSSDFDPVYAVGEPLLRRPRKQGSVDVSAHAGPVSGGVTWTAVGERADSDFLGLGLTRNPGYDRVDARVRVRILSRLQAFAAAENLFDEEYMEALGYPAPGRSVRVGIRLQTDPAHR